MSKITSNKNSKLNVILTLILVGFVSVNCFDDLDNKNNPPPPPPPTNNPLAGSVWVHHPDTDTDSPN